MNDEWVTTEDGVEYKNITTNGKWQVVRFRGNAAYYSFCPYCGYTHDCYHDIRNPVTEEWEGIEYAPEKEFNYCPMCGERMKG